MFCNEGIHVHCKFFFWSFKVHVNNLSALRGFASHVFLVIMPQGSASGYFTKGGYIFNSK